MQTALRSFVVNTLVSAACFVTISAVAAAQVMEFPPRPARMEAGAAFEVADPVGDFGLNEYTGKGAVGHLVLAVGSDTRFGIRLDAAYFDFGSHVRTFPSSELHENTANDIGMMTVGPQFGLRKGRLRPYVNAGAGVAYFYSQKGFNTPGTADALQGTTNYSSTNKASLLYTGGAGLNIPVSVRAREFAIDVGARFNSAKDAKYMPENHFHMPGGYGETVLYQHEATANFLGYHVGFSAQF
jgi:hypothetical protein